MMYYEAVDHGCDGLVATTNLTILGLLLATLHSPELENYTTDVVLPQLRGACGPILLSTISLNYCVTVYGIYILTTCSYM